MTRIKAIDTLKRAGLHVRYISPFIVGGSHVDRSASCGIIRNEFGIKPAASGLYHVTFEESTHGPMTLEAAVNKIIETVKPEPDVEAIPKPPSPDGVTYY